MIWKKANCSTKKPTLTKDFALTELANAPKAQQEVELRLKGRKVTADEFSEAMGKADPEAIKKELFYDKYGESAVGLPVVKMSMTFGCSPL